MATAKKAKKNSAKEAKSSTPPGNGPKKSRLWLMYPPKLIKIPVIWELGHRFKVVTNVRQASVTDEIGIVCLEMEGVAAEMESAIEWLTKMGISVEPVEITVLES